MWRLFSFQSRPKRALGPKWRLFPYQSRPKRALVHWVALGVPWVALGGRYGALGSYGAPGRSGTIIKKYSVLVPRSAG